MSITILRADHIAKTAKKLSQRIFERFPRSGLFEVSERLLALSERSIILGWTAAATPVLAALIAAVESTEAATFPATIGFTWFFVGTVVWLYRY